MKLHSHGRLTPQTRQMPPEREAFEQQALDQLLLVVADLLRVGGELAPTLEAAVILLSVVGVPVHLDMR